MGGLARVEPRYVEHAAMLKGLLLFGFLLEFLRFFLFLSLVLSLCVSIFWNDVEGSSFTLVISAFVESVLATSAELAVEYSDGLSSSEAICVVYWVSFAILSFTVFLEGSMFKITGSAVDGIVSLFHRDCCFARLSRCLQPFFVVFRLLPHSNGFFVTDLNTRTNCGKLSVRIGCQGGLLKELFHFFRRRTGWYDDRTSGN